MWKCSYGRAGVITMDESTLRLRHPDSIGQAFLWALLPTLALVLIAPSLGDAQVQVTTSITSTPGAGNLATTITHAGDLYNITGGTRPGNGLNLFHSFGDFSVGQGDIGNFLNDTGLPTSNILGRVTGGNPSNIDGIVQTTGFGNANLFLVNPSGIVLGPTGSVDVGGSVSFTTAQYLRLFDNVNSANFYANPASDGLANSVLAVAPVVDFGFLSPAAYGFLTPPNPNATITVQGSALSVPSGQSISLVGGKISIQAGTLPDGTVQPAHLSALNGTIQLATAASPGEFDVATLGSLPNVNDASFTSFGSVSLAPGSSIDVNGVKTVFVKGGQLVLSVNDATLSTSEGLAPQDMISLNPGSSIVTSNLGTEPGADVQITVETLQMGGTSIQSTTTGDGSGGNITADVGTLALTNGAAINSNSLFGLGQGGNVTMQGLQGSGSSATSMSLDNSTISTMVSGGNSASTAARIDITVQTLALANQAIIRADTFGVAPAGDITLKVGTLTGGPFSAITSNSWLQDATAGNAGNIMIQGITGSGSPAADVKLDTSLISTEIFGGSAATTPGAITITAQTLDLTNAGTIGADTHGAAPAGNIALNVGTLTLGDAHITSNSWFQDATAGNAGNITIQGVTGSGSSVANVRLEGGVSSISTITTQILGGSAATPPATITITAQTLDLAKAHMGAATLGTAPAGDITLNVDTLTVGNAGIDSTSNSTESTAGNAGNITIQGITGSGSPAANVILDNFNISTAIFGGSAATTPSAITITAQTLALLNYGLGIRADTNGKAPAGNITLNVDTLTVGNSTISSSSSPFDFSLDSAAGNAGSITIQGVTGAGTPAANVSLDNSTISTTIGGGTSSTTPATIDITAQTVNLANGAQISAETHGAAPAGDIALNVDTLTAGSSQITSNSFLQDVTAAGNAGNITIQGVTGSGSPAAHVSLDNSNISTTISGGSAATTPGAITITAQTLALANRAHIGVDTIGAAPAGDITLNVGTLTVDSSGILLPGEEGGVVDFSGITSNSGVVQLDQSDQLIPQDATAGNAGNITIQGITGSGSPAAHVSLDHSTISTVINGGTSTSTPATITITAHTLDLLYSRLPDAQKGNFGAFIVANTSSAAPAGNITLNVDTLTVASNSFIISDSSFNDSTAGNAGSITIQGITGSGSPAAHVSLDHSRISTEIFDGGSAATTPGTITITAHTLDLANDANITADTFGTAPAGGPAGDITLNVGTLTVGNSSIASSSCCNESTAGNAGNITIQGITGSGSPAADVRLDHSGILTEINGGTSTSTPATITITAHTLALANEASIRAGTTGAAPAGDITLNVGSLTVDSSGIRLPGGSGGGVEMFFGITSISGLLQVDESGQPIPQDATAGNAGDITIQGITGSGSPAAHVSLDGSMISTQISGGRATTTPGTITITAHTLALANGANIGADTVGTGPAGDIVLNVGTLTAGNSAISSRSSFIDSTAGNAGDITIQGITGSGSPAAHVSLDNSIVSTTIAGGTSSSIPAAIEVTAQTVNLANGSQIKADTIGVAPAGNIAVNVDTLTAGNSTISSSSSPAFIDALGVFSEGGGNAGNITIQGITSSGSPAAHVSLDNSIVSTTIAGGTLSNVPANITIAAQSVTLSNDVAITASTIGNAPAGNIGLVTQQLTMAPDSAITSNAQDGGGTTGRAGSITITGAGSAPTTITGGTIQAQSETSASAGDITLQAPGDLTLLGTTVSVKNTGPGSAGSINLLAGNDLLVRNSQVSTESAEASGGNIKLTAPNLVRIVDSTLTSSVQGQAGSNGGNINIDPQLVVIQNSQLLANANAGAGGNITIAATGAVLVDPNSRIDASAGPAGVSGSVNINAPIQVLSGTLVPLNLAYSQAELSGDRCAADPTGQFSSFVQTGRDGVPQVPGALSPSPLSFLETLTSSSLGSPSPNWAATRLGLDAVRVDDLTRFRFYSACRS